MKLVKLWHKTMLLCNLHLLGIWRQNIFCSQDLVKFLKYFKATPKGWTTSPLPWLREQFSEAHGDLQLWWHQGGAWELRSWPGLLWACGWARFDTARNPLVTVSYRLKVSVTLQLFLASPATNGVCLAPCLHWGSRSSKLIHSKTHTPKAVIFHFISNLSWHSHSCAIAGCRVRQCRQMDGQCSGTAEQQPPVTLDYM